MLVELAHPVTFNDAVSPVCLPSATATVTSDTPCYATGWGKTNQSTYTIIYVDHSYTVYCVTFRDLSIINCAVKSLMDASHCRRFQLIQNPKSVIAIPVLPHAISTAYSLTKPTKISRDVVKNWLHGERGTNPFLLVRHQNINRFRRDVDVLMKIK